MVEHLAGKVTVAGGGWNTGYGYNNKNVMKENKGK